MANAVDRVVEPVPATPNRTSRFRASLLTALGFLPLACSSSTVLTSDPNDGYLPLDSNGQVTCTSPEEQFTGLVLCAEGYEHRPASASCSTMVDANAAPIAGGTGGTSGNPVPQPGCDTDQDCAATEACVCWGDGRGACMPASCRTDSECGEAEVCSKEWGAGGCSPKQFFVGMECVRPAVKGSGGGGGTVSCGRPFLVEAAARVAPAIASGHWAKRQAPAPRVDHLSEAERAQLAQHWTEMGQMEHASIAAFARFSLQLLSLGAPPELVEACTQALADETAHTLLCFDLASAYAGQAIGPGPLDVNGSLLASSLVDIVDLVIVEGCFGETSAALEALEAAEPAADPVIFAAYSQIARDEQRHAELAFRFVRWALQRGGDAVQERIIQALATPPSRDASVIGVTLPCLAALLSEQTGATVSPAPATLAAS